VSFLLSDRVEFAAVYDYMIFHCVWGKAFCIVTETKFILQNHDRALLFSKHIPGEKCAANKALKGGPEVFPETSSSLGVKW